MLKRIYVDNIASLVGFEARLTPICLFVGPNGTGKTTVFEVLDSLRLFVIEQSRTDEVFSWRTLTKWRDDPVSIVEVAIEDAGLEFVYRLEVEHEASERKSRVKCESLRLGGKPLFESSEGRARLYRDDHSEGQLLTLDRSRSGIGVIESKPEHSQLTRFRQLIGGMLSVRINPFRMPGRASDEQRHPSADFSDFSAWFRHLSQERPERMQDLFTDLSAAIPGFVSLRLREVADNERDLKAVMEVSRNGGQAESVEFRLEELSEGQRALLVIYTVLHCASEPGAILLLDEIDNFVALPELQPWLVALADKVRCSSAQALIISHHPEIIDYLASEDVLVFSRRPDGSAVAKPLDFDPSSGSKLSEVIARGWLDE